MKFQLDKISQVQISAIYHAYGSQNCGYTCVTKVGLMFSVFTTFFKNKKKIYPSPLCEINNFYLLKKENDGQMYYLDVEKNEKKTPNVSIYFCVLLEFVHFFWVL